MLAIICVGVSASGKSTYADKWLAENTNSIEVNRDSYRKKLTLDAGKEWGWANWNWKREKEVTALCDADIEFAAKNEFDIIISDTNLNIDRLRALEEKLRGLGFHTQFKEFPISIEEAWARDAKRMNGVGHSVIAQQYEKWLEYSGAKKYVADTSKPKCILVDIDGTLAHMNGKRGAFEWDKVGHDTVDEAVKFMVNAYHDVDKEMVDEVILLSGRDGCCYTSTHKWLIDNGIWFDRLLMRYAGDMRKDTIVKEEIFWRNIADNYDVQFVIDDRPSVCRMWRDLGLKVMQVGNPYIEF